MLVKMGVLQAVSLLSGIGLLRDKIAPKSALSGTLLKPNRVSQGQFSTPDEHFWHHML